MRLDAAGEDVVAVDDQVMRGDRRGQIVGPPSRGIGHAFLGGDMFHHHAQAGHAAAQRVQHGVDEHRLAVEDVDLRVGHLAMQRKAAGRSRPSSPAPACTLARSRTPECELVVAPAG